MATMNVSLPEGLKDWVEGQMEGGRFSSASDYVRHLIRMDQERADKIAAMQKLIDDAEASGRGTRSVEQIFEAVIARHKGN